MLDDNWRSRVFATGATCALALAAGCSRAPAPVDPGPDVQVLGESTRIRLEDPVPAASPWFDGKRVTITLARGETVGIQVLHRAGGAVALAIPGARVQAYAVENLPVVRPSTELYGGSRAAGTYADGLVPTASPTSNPAYFEIAADRSTTGELDVGGKKFPVDVTVAPVDLPPLQPSVWAYEDPREFAPDRATVSPGERACIATFRAYGVVLSPDLDLAWWPARKELLGGFPHIPVVIDEDPTKAAEQVRGWIAATRGTGQVPFAIPVDEPHDAEARAKVRAIGDAVHAAGGGPTTFRMAVTDGTHPDYGDAVDLYISWRAAHLSGDRGERWTYNGAPPFAGSMTLDAETPGTRTWGWIAWRWKIPVWYVWDALYWHDRHNAKRHKLERPGRALDLRDPISFDDGDDRGNLDGVLALPDPSGCKPTLRLAALRRGLQDRALLDLAARCAPDKAAAVAARMVPRALGDAEKGAPRAWPADEAAWELARRELLELARCR